LGLDQLFQKFRTKFCQKILDLDLDSGNLVLNPESDWQKYLMGHGQAIF